jgi:hypothetical protein
MDLAALQAKAVAASPMSAGAVPVLQGRTLYLDGDGLAYYCAGNDDTLLGEARSRTADKIRGMAASCAAGQQAILLTGSGSHKGHRYAVARVKPYQGQRANSRRPKNWQGLRDLLADGYFGTSTVSTTTAEADDLFGHHGHRDPANTVIGTQDKDMRMVPGWHMDWVSNLMCYLPPDTYDFKFNDKQFGLKWFWLQMLHGDTADQIPGLPWYMGKDAKGAGKLKAVGPVTAEAMLAETKCNVDALVVVHAAYKSYYKERALVEMMEQAVLLWMRRDAESKWYDCLMEGGPLFPCRAWNDNEEFFLAYAEIEERILTVESYAALESQ